MLAPLLRKTRVTIEREGAKGALPWEGGLLCVTLIQGGPLKATALALLSQNVERMWWAGTPPTTTPLPSTPSSFCRWINGRSRPLCSCVKETRPLSAKLSTFESWNGKNMLTAPKRQLFLQKRQKLTSLNWNKAKVDNTQVFCYDTEQSKSVTILVSITQPFKTYQSLLGCNNSVGTTVGPMNNKHHYRNWIFVRMWKILTNT